MLNDDLNKVVIVGCGNVGMSYAFSLVIDSKVNELVLIDINQQKAEGEALDLLHASSVSQHKIKIKVGDYSDCDNADIVCIAAGRNQEKGEDRNALIDKNIGVFKSIITQINKSKFNGIYLIATNPLDVMTYVTLKLSGFSPEQVIGSGTTLDTARLQYIISEHVDVNPKNIHGYVIGEHGESEMVPWSMVRVGVNAAEKYLSKAQQKKIVANVRNSAYEIINKKGNTAYGIGICLRNITDEIFNDSNYIFTVSTYIKKYGCCVGYPAIVNRSGIKGILPISLTPEEQKEFNNSVKKIKSNIKNLKLN